MLAARRVLNSVIDASSYNTRQFSAEIHGVLDADVKALTANSVMNTIAMCSENQTTSLVDEGEEGHLLEVYGMDALYRPFRFWLCVSDSVEIGSNMSVNWGLKRDVVEREFNEISAMRPASLTPTQLALGRVWA